MFVYKLANKVKHACFLEYKHACSFDYLVPLALICLGVQYYEVMRINAWFHGTGHPENDEKAWSK